MNRKNKFLLTNEVIATVSDIIPINVSSHFFIKDVQKCNIVPVKVSAIINTTSSKWSFILFLVCLYLKYSLNWLRVMLLFLASIIPYIFKTKKSYDDKAKQLIRIVSYRERCHRDVIEIPDIVAFRVTLVTFMKYRTLITKCTFELLSILIKVK